MADLEKLSVEELKSKKKTLMMQNAGIGMIGSLAGVVYNVKTGGGFWRGVLFFFAGGFVVGIVPRIAYFIPQTNKVDGVLKKKLNEQTQQQSEEMKKVALANKPTATTSSTSTKDLKIEKMPIKKPTLIKTTTRPMTLRGIKPII